MKAEYCGVDGVARKITKEYRGVGGVARKVTKAYRGVSGVARQYFESGTPLSSLAEGSIIQINENGSLVDFYVAKHDYESGLNGAGRTLVLRKNSVARTKWHTSKVNSYASSNLNKYLNETYKNTLSSDLLELIGTTKFYYTPGRDGGGTEITTLERSIFALSLYEYGYAVGVSQDAGDNANNEGSVLPNAEAYRIALLDNGDTANHWTRTPNKTNKVAVMMTAGQWTFTYPTSSTMAGYRPAFTLPSETNIEELLV